jgi:signal transduction histidine kinase
MRNPFKLSANDAPYQAQLREALADDLYRRALFPLLVFIPFLYVFYLVTADVIPRRPVIGWILIFMIAVLIPRIAAVLFVGRIKARYPDPKIRVGIFATTAFLLGASMAAINIIAAPLVSVEQLALLMIISAGINSIAIVSMSPSLTSYLLYMVPNIASMSVVIVISPAEVFSGVFLFLTITNLISLIFMSTVVHLKERRSILLRLKVGETNVALQQVNLRLSAEIQERLAVEDALKRHNTELEALTQKLAGARIQLLQSEKLASVGQLAAGVAHEINNPIAFVRSNLSSLTGYVQNIVSVLDAYGEVETARENKDGALRKLEQLKDSTNVAFLREDIPCLLKESCDGLTRVEKIVKDLRDFSNIDAANWQIVDIHQCLESTLSVAAHEIRRKAEVVRDYGDVPPIECLPFELNQVFLNLLINAAQSIEQYGVITLCTGRHEQSIWVEITDTGVGIEPEHLNRIFEPFFTTKAVGVGPGLGLSVSYGIVQNLGGTIDVKSVVGKGSTFTICLPIVAKRATQ